MREFVRRTSVLGAFTVALQLVLSACGTQTVGGDDYTLLVEVTSTGSASPFTGHVSPNNASERDISGTTPFSVRTRDTREECTDVIVISCVTGASVTVTTKTNTGAPITVCRSNGHKVCSGTTATSSTTSAILTF